MAAAAIKKEMRPRGVLRSVFGDLARSGGAYILATNEDVGSNGARTRLHAMRAELKGLAGSEGIALDFYSADKLARWANCHVGVAMWLRENDGRELMGWRPFGPWSTSYEAPYLLDETARVSINGKTDATVVEAIATIRHVLNAPRGAVRLVGISGMGKTRLAEALFDNTVDGATSLSRSLAIYGDAGLDLAIPPPAAAERLATSGTRAVLVVDNCTDRLHRQLAEIVARKRSGTSLLTIDYELDGEKLEGTCVVRLGQSSDATIDDLIAQRFPDLNSLVRKRLTEFGGGNARIALAIARGVREGDSLTDLDDMALIDRLFQDERRGYYEACRRGRITSLRFPR